ncbi:MAG: hypothetical protein OXF02_05600 [Simkaniaceae bacterium]|nr:hypothetical protein [Simkaniaceae bacterium]
MASAIGEGQGAVWPVNDCDGTAVWTRKFPGGPPLWFKPLPKGRERRKYTETEKCAIVDYALEVRRTKSIGVCAEEIGVNASSLSSWIRWGCEAYPIFADLYLDDDILRRIDYRKLLADLRSGIRSVTVSNYIGDSKDFSRKSMVGRKRANVPAQGEIRGDHPYFFPPEKGKRRVFSEAQKTRVLDYWFCGGNRQSLSECARKCNLCTKTLIDWVNACESQQTCPDSTELSESFSEATVFDPEESSLPDMPWWEVKKFCP